MSLRKSPTRTAAFLKANRRNAQKSTGPKTARGKAWTRFNSLRHGFRSPEYINFYYSLHDAPPGGIIPTVVSLLEPRAIRHPLFIQKAEDFIEADYWVNDYYRRQRELRLAAACAGQMSTGD